MYLYSKDQRIALTIEDVKNENKHISFSVDSTPQVQGYIRYLMTSPPIYNFNQKVVETFPESNGEEFVQKWIVVNLTQQEINEKMAVKKQELKNLAASIRKSIESTGYHTVLDVPFPIDLNTQSKLLGVFVMSQQIPNFTVNWKCANGVFHTFNKSQIQMISSSVMNKVQELFNKEYQFVTEINNATTLEKLSEIEIDINSWIN